MVKRCSRSINAKIRKESFDLLILSGFFVYIRNRLHASHKKYDVSENGCSSDLMAVDKARLLIASELRHDQFRVSVLHHPDTPAVDK